MPAPTPGQDNNNTRPPQDLVNSNGTATVINVPTAAPSHVDVRIRGRYVQYTTDPRPDAGTPGLWRAYGDCPPEFVSPFALQQIGIGQHGYEIRVCLPRTGETRTFEGGLDQIASALHRAGVRRGCRAERKLVFWALREFSDQARRQAAARGGEV